MRHIGSGTKSFVLERFAESWHICSMFMVYVGILKICLCQKSICFEETSSFFEEYEAKKAHMPTASMRTKEPFLDGSKKESSKYVS